MINRFYINIKLFTFIKNLIYGKNFNITKIISSYYNKNQFIFFSKGRIALYNILKNELKSYKNEVLISPYTLPVIIDIIYQAGGNPVFIDMDISTGLPKIKDLKKKISPKTSLILITHLFSKKKELKEISNLKKTKKIKIVEDLAINFGLRNKNKFTSLNSDYSFFSFNYMKNFSTVNGGMAYVKNKKDFKKLIDKTVKLDRSSNLDLFLNLSKILFLKLLFNKYFFNFFTFFIFSVIEKQNIKILKKILYPGFSKKKFNYSDNYRLNIVSTNFFPSSVKELEKDIIIRKSKAFMYFKNLKNNEFIDCVNPKEVDSVHLEYFCFVKKNFKKLYNYLLDNGIYLRKHWYKNNSKRMKNSYLLEKNSLLLPTHVKIKESEIIYISKKINEFYK